MIVRPARAGISRLGTTLPQAETTLTAPGRSVRLAAMRVPALPDPFPKAFQIGVRPVGIAEWIDVDDRLPAYLDDKQWLFADRHDAVFAAEPDTEAAQAETLSLLAAHLTTQFPHLYQRHADTIDILPAKRQVDLAATATAPLQIAAGLVQEDLVLMRHGASGWRVAAAALCFPSSWRLADKVGRPIHEVHAPVPGFGAGTRGAQIVARMFDAMLPGVWALRWNWSLYGDDALHHPDESPPHRFGTGDRADPVFLRLERQTLTKLPVSGDIVFTIRIYVDPLEAVARQPRAHGIATSLIGQLEAMDAEQLAYKGLTGERERLLRRLRELAER